MKETEEDLQKREDITYPWTAGIHVIKLPHYPSTQQIQCTLYQTASDLLHRTRETTPEFIKTTGGNPTRQSKLE